MTINNYKVDMYCMFQHPYECYQHLCQHPYECYQHFFLYITIYLLASSNDILSTMLYIGNNSFAFHGISTNVKGGTKDVYMV